MEIKISPEAQKRFQNTDTEIKEFTPLAHLIAEEAERREQDNEEIIKISRGFNKKNSKPNIVLKKNCISACCELEMTIQSNKIIIHVDKFNGAWGWGYTKLIIDMDTLLKRLRNLKHPMNTDGFIITVKYQNCYLSIDFGFLTTTICFDSYDALWPLQRIEHSELLAMKTREILELIQEIREAKQ